MAETVNPDFWIMLCAGGFAVAVLLYWLWTGARKRRP